LGDQATREKKGEGWDESEDGDEAELAVGIGLWRLVGHCFCKKVGARGVVADGGILIGFEM
jgi:hypothetical protein